MRNKNTAVLGTYPSYADVENVVARLKMAGFNYQDISVLFPRSKGSQSQEISVLFPRSTESNGLAHEKGAKEATTGAGVRLVVGGTMGWFLGIRPLAIPGLGPFIGAGPIVAALAGAGAGDTIGGITGALTGMGIPESEAKRYEGRVKQGGILLSVHSGSLNRTQLARQILAATGAKYVSATSETSSDGTRVDRHLRRAG